MSSLQEINQLSWNDFKILCKTNNVKLNGKRPEVTQKLCAKLGIAIEEKKPKVDGLKVLESVSYGLKNIYEQKLYPLEEYYRFHEFYSPALDNPDFTVKPMILLIGQYSTDKTTFIRYLLEQDFPNMQLDPEPTTDRFTAVMYDKDEGSIPGNALVVDSNKQFRALTKFGDAFLDRFECSTLKNDVLNSVTIVDTPEILSGEEQEIDRGYDFTGVFKWFAERVDRIVLLFDAHKLDISDEFKRCIEALSGNEDKIRIVLNKSGMADHQQSLMNLGWSLGKIFKTESAPIVYAGTFNDKKLRNDLLADLQLLPRNAALRKLNDLVKRARLAKVHAYIIAELRKQMPSMIDEEKKNELIENLDKLFEQLQKEHSISPGEFPDVEKMRENLKNADFTRFNEIKPRLLEAVDNILASDIARLMSHIPNEENFVVVHKTNEDYQSVYAIVKKEQPLTRKSVIRVGIACDLWKRWTDYKRKCSYLNDKSHGMVPIMKFNSSNLLPGISTPHQCALVMEHVTISFAEDFSLEANNKAGNGCTDDPEIKTHLDRADLKRFASDAIDKTLIDGNFVCVEDTKKSSVRKCLPCGLTFDSNTKRRAHFFEASHWINSKKKPTCKSCKLEFEVSEYNKLVNHQHNDKEHKRRVAEAKAKKVEEKSSKSTKVSVQEQLKSGEQEVRQHQKHDRESLFAELDISDALGENEEDQLSQLAIKATGDEWAGTLRTSKSNNARPLGIVSVKTPKRASEDVDDISKKSSKRVKK